jgi:hypothetical protein
VQPVVVSVSANESISLGAAVGVTVGAIFLLCIVLLAAYYMHSLPGRNSTGTDFFMFIISIVSWLILANAYMLCVV